MRKPVLWEILAWLVVSCGLGLLQVWIGFGYKWFRNESLGVEALLLSGGLIFFANSLAMEVAWLRLKELGALARSESGTASGHGGRIAYLLLLPAIVLAASIVMYCALLSAPTEKGRIFTCEYVLVLLSVGAHLTQRIEFARHFDSSQAHSG
jgi:hypothetical protein